MEDKWFPNTTWEGEAVTKVFFRAADAKTASLIKKMVEQYLGSLFFKNLDSELGSGVKGSVKYLSSYIWLVDMSRKEFKLINNWEASTLEREEGIPYAKPSHLPLYMKQFRGTLTGAKFGI
jgi:hypothetical protein